jgi:NifU-like protein involved in Fe-S cluster formation
LFVEISNSRLQRVRYQAYGCPHFLAACESLAQWLEGHECSRITQWRWRQVETELSVPASKRSRLLLLQEALSQLSQLSQISQIS